MNYPVDKILPHVARALDAGKSVVLQAPPGSGKTTRVAPYLLNTDASWLRGKKIILLEPRRLAARMAAHFMARERGESVGQSIGYRIRLKNCTSRSTRIEILTEGLLTQRLLADPELADTALIIFDEFHERSLAADTGLALTLDMRSALRPDLRLIVMSATLAAAPVADRLGDAKILTAEGRMYPVETVYAPSLSSPFPVKYCQPSVVAGAIARAVAKESGSTLVFLPGEGEIRRTEQALREMRLPDDISIHPLFSALPKNEQDAAIEPPPPGRRKVVLATSIAESSLTIEGIRVVIDSGWMRVPRFSPATGMTRLDTLRITRDRADQRRGRAGRLCPGVCYRLWDEVTDHQLAPESLPEILDADLTPLVLQCAEWGTIEREGLPWLTPPPDAAWRRGLALLRELGAIEGNSITERGRAMVRFPVHPRLSHMILQAAAAHCAQRACLLAAVISEAPGESSLRRETDLRRLVDRARNTREGFGSRVEELSERWGNRFPEKDTAFLSDGVLLAWAFPDRLAKRRDAAGHYLLRSGRGAVIETSDPLASSAWLVCAELQDAEGDARIRLAVPLTEDEVNDTFAEETETITLTRWDKREEAVSAVRQRRLGAIVLYEGGQPSPDADAVNAALCEGIRQKGISQLPWSKSAADLRDRIIFLHRHLPDQEWPDLSDSALAETIEDWLIPFCSGISRWTKVAQLDLSNILLCLLADRGCTRQKLDELAPTHVTVPSGSRIHLRYDQDPPYLAVRIQEVFGMNATPKIAGGRVAVVMHLLSPAQRPVQVTSDLESFWKEGYAFVRKDMRGRYPKHYWPEDPRQAEPTRRVRPASGTR